MSGITPEEKEALQESFDNLNRIEAEVEQAFSEAIEAVGQFIDNVVGVFLPPQNAQHD